MQLPTNSRYLRLIDMLRPVTIYKYTISLKFEKKIEFCPESTDLCVLKKK
jgi:hypothetical protein